MLNYSVFCLVVLLEHSRDGACSMISGHPPTWGSIPAQTHCWSSHCVGIKAGWKSEWELNWVSSYLWNVFLAQHVCCFIREVCTFPQGCQQPSEVHLPPSTLNQVGGKWQCCLVLSTLAMQQKEKDTSKLPLKVDVSTVIGTVSGRMRHY